MVFVCFMMCLLCLMCCESIKLFKGKKEIIVAVSSNYQISNSPDPVRQADIIYDLDREYEWISRLFDSAPEL